MILSPNREKIDEAEKKRNLRNNLEKWNAMYVPHTFDKVGMKKMAVQEFQES